MKRILPLIAIMGLVLVTVSCQKPEEVTLSKYFQAMKADKDGKPMDRDTMAAMAADPVQIQFDEWKMVSSEPPVEADIAIPDLVNQLNELKKQKNEQSLKTADKFAISKELKDKVQGARRVAPALQKEFDEAQAAFEAEKKVLDQISLQHNELKAKLDFEKRLFTLSTNIEREHELFTGKAQDVKTLVSITSAGAAKEYVFLLRKYILDQPGSERKTTGRFVIVKIAPQDEFEQK